jgi:hypothetical protein
MDRQTFERHLALAEGRDGVKALLSRPPGRAPLQWRVVLMLYWTARKKQTPSRDRWPGVDRQLGGERPPVGGPRFAAGDVGGQGRKFVEDAG